MTDYTSLVIIIAIALFTLIVEFSFLVFQKRCKVQISPPLGMKLDIDWANQTPEKRQRTQVLEYGLKITRAAALKSIK